MFFCFQPDKNEKPVDEMEWYATENIFNETTNTIKEL